MKKLYILSLLMLSTGSIYSSSSSDAATYQESLKSALSKRYAGDDGYESGSDNMKSIRMPRSAQVGVDQEAQEYIDTKSQMPGFVKETPLQRFTLKGREYLDKVESGKITPEEYVAVMTKKLTTYNKSMKKTA